MALAQQQPIAMTFEQYATKTAADNVAWSSAEYEAQQTAAKTATKVVALQLSEAKEQKREIVPTYAA